MSKNQSKRKVTNKSQQQRPRAQAARPRANVRPRRRPRRVNNNPRSGVIQSMRQNYVPVSYSNQAKTKAHRYTVKHSEVIESTLVPTGAKFSLMKEYKLNPGSPTSFPWLHTIARCYDKYSIKKFSVTFVPYVATSQVGDICMIFIADPRQIIPTTVDAASQYDGAVSGSAYKQLTLNLSSQQLSRLDTYFVDAPNQTKGDTLFYDVGTLCIFSD